MAKDMRFEMPNHVPGQRVGLLGGSFDPPHQGHLHISKEALKRFDLDCIWWLVTPGNPLKTHGPAPLEKRLTAARNLVDHPRIHVTAIEQQLGTTATAQTIAHLRRLYRDVSFTWLMGADNLAQLHRWQNWRTIMRHVPVGVLARPGDRISARTSPAARLFRPYKIKASNSRALSTRTAPAWCFVNVPLDRTSSSAIRENGNWYGA